jgi:hypothetical protein
MGTEAPSSTEHASSKSRLASSGDASTGFTRGLHTGANTRAQQTRWTTVAFGCGLLYMCQVHTWSFGLALAVGGAIACHQQTLPQAPAHGEEHPVQTPPKRARAVVPMAHGSEAYLGRLWRGFLECGRHELAKLDGHWSVAGSPAREVWICDGRMRWRADWGGVSEMCFSEANTVDGGIEGEGILHEDLNDPGDAQGFYIFLKYRNGRLAIEAAGWEEPSSRSQFFLLERRPDAAERPGMLCPLP